MKTQFTLLSIVLTVLWFAPGCETKSAADKKGKTTSGHSDHDGHDHGHGDHDDHGHDDHKHDASSKDDHDHGHGPNGGHIAHFDTAQSVHFEWAHDDTNQVFTVYLDSLVSQGAKIDSAKVDVSLNGDTKSFPLEADEKAKLKGSIFMAKSPELLTLVGASGDDPKGTQAKLIVVIDGKTETALLKDDHDHHH